MGCILTVMRDMPVSHVLLRLILLFSYNSIRNGFWTQGYEFSRVCEMPWNKALFQLMEIASLLLLNFLYTWSWFLVQIKEVLSWRWPVGGNAGCTCGKPGNGEITVLYLLIEGDISYDTWMLIYMVIYTENRPNTSQLANAINTGRGLPWFFFAEIDW